MTAVSISIFAAGGRLLLGKDAEMDCWSLPGGAVDANKQPADAAVRECFEETRLLVKLDALIGIFGGPEFLVHYPNGDVTYYTTAAFRGFHTSPWTDSSLIFDISVEPNAIAWTCRRQVGLFPGRNSRQHASPISH
jgi:ADP-ribose pyrophosphatase YjhB (NUDIX family)